MKLLFWRTTTPHVRQRPICADCGGRDVEAHGMLSWNEALQDWQIAEARDYGSCPDCGSTEVGIRWMDY